MPFEITILGANSATPTPNRHPSSQLINVKDSYLLIDCGEATQIQLMRFHLRFNRIQHIFISHLHGDHFLGLPGLLSTMSHLGRKAPLHLYGPAALFPYLEMVWNMNNFQLGFELITHTTQDEAEEWICTDTNFRVKTFPLKHRIPTTGFLVEEVQDTRHIIPHKCRENNVPYEDYPALKRGEDYTNPDGVSIPNGELTRAAHRPRTYAYCSDTRFAPELIHHYGAVDMLYHEATFLHDMSIRAAETGHSTAKEAAEIATLCNAGQLLLGHYSARYRDLTPLLDEAKQVFPASQLAIEGECYAIERNIMEATASAM